MNKIVIYTLSAFILLAILVSSLFIVDEREQAVIFQFGQVVGVEREPGLKFKIPLIQTIAFYEKRYLNAMVEEKEIIAKDQKRLIVNAYAKYQIIDPLKFYQTVKDERGVRVRLNSIIESSLRQVIGGVPLGALLTTERSSIMRNIRDAVDRKARSFGINVVDVRILRADLPQANSDAIYRRMETERHKEAKEIRAQGEEEYKKITSRADKDRKVLIAEALKEAEIKKGEGDSIAAGNYAKAFNQDPEFFELYRTLAAYKNSLSDKDTTMVLSPDSDFMKFFGNIDGRRK